MSDAILGILGIALIGALTAPLLMLVLARFGFFEPIEIHVLGRTFRCAPGGRETLSPAMSWYPRTVLASAGTVMFFLHSPVERMDPHSPEVLMAYAAGAVSIRYE